MESQQQLAIYDAMVNAINVCERVDEVKDIRDKARALEAYARQAQNIEAERKATAIRLRAERRAGELMQLVERERGIRTDIPTSNQRESKLEKTLTENKISKTQALRWQALAAVPAEQFEKHLRDPVAIPTTTGIIEASKTVPTGPRMNDVSLWVWGRLRDFERMRCVDSDPNEIFDGMTETMQADVRRILPAFIGWCEQLTTETINA